MNGQTCSTLNCHARSTNTGHYCTACQARICGYANGLLVSFLDLFQGKTSQEQEQCAFAAGSALAAETLSIEGFKPDVMGSRPADRQQKDPSKKARA